MPSPIPIATEKGSVKYTYGIEFPAGAHSCLSVYYDLLGMTMPPKLDSVATNLAVFDVEEPTSAPARTFLDSTPLVRLLGHLECSTSQDYFSGWAVHPTLPIMAVQACGISRQLPWVMLWNFDTGEWSSTGAPSVMLTCSDVQVAI